MEFNAHFGLRKTPFTREVAVSELFVHPQYDEVVERLTRVVHERMSAGLVAAAGLGKTTMVRALRDALPDVRYHVHYVKVTGEALVFPPEGLQHPRATLEVAVGLDEDVVLFGELSESGVGRHTERYFTRGTKSFAASSGKRQMDVATVFQDFHTPTTKPRDD